MKSSIGCGFRMQNSLGSYCRHPDRHIEHNSCAIGTASYPPGCPVAEQALVEELKRGNVILTRALERASGALWNCDPQGNNWTYVYDKYIRYATEEIEKDKK